MRISQNHIITIYRLLRKLAKEGKYQILYSQYKEAGVRIFKNDTNFTDFQIAFLQYLSFYAGLHMAIYMDEVSDIVLDNDIYEDAYSYYKNNSKKKERKAQNKILKPKTNKPKGKTNVSNTHVVFSKPRIKR